MRAASLIVVSLIFAAPAIAVDLPKPLTEEQRSKLVKQWQSGYDKAFAKAQNALDDAELKKDKRAIAELTKTLEAMRKEPLKSQLMSSHGFSPIYTSNARKVGWLHVPTLNVKEILPEGVIVEGTFKANTVLGSSGHYGYNFDPPLRETIVVRYLVASPLPDAKPKAKIKLDGLWYVAGKGEVGNRSMPVLYRFEMKPDEIPKK